MAILTHGSELALAPSIRPLLQQGRRSVRAAIELVATSGFNHVQLDATVAGIRPRDLDRRGRKDLQALLVRRSLILAGLDLFIPRAHFRQGEHLDRAMAAVVAGIELAADLGRVPVSLPLPVKAMADDVKSAFVEAAEARGVPLAIHAEDQVEPALAWVQEVDLRALGVAIDPAAILSRGGNPVDVAHRLGKHLRVARLSDLAGQASDEDEGPSGVRCVVGEGELDVVGYRVALDLAQGRAGPVVLDLRGLKTPAQAATVAKRVWDNAAFTV